MKFNLDAQADNDFDHAVATAHQLFPSRVGELLAEAGFVDVHHGTAPPAEGARPLGKGTVLARRGMA